MKRGLAQKPGGRRMETGPLAGGAFFDPPNNDSPPWKPGGVHRQDTPLPVDHGLRQDRFTPGGGGQGVGS